MDHSSLMHASLGVSSMSSFAKLWASCTKSWSTTKTLRDSQPFVRASQSTSQPWESRPHHLLSPNRSSLTLCYHALEFKSNPMPTRPTWTCSSTKLSSTWVAMPRFFPLTNRWQKTLLSSILTGFFQILLGSWWQSLHSLDHMCTTIMAMQRRAMSLRCWRLKICLVVQLWNGCWPRFLHWAQVDGCRAQSFKAVGISMRRALEPRRSHDYQCRVPAQVQRPCWFGGRALSTPPSPLLSPLSLRLWREAADVERRDSSCCCKTRASWSLARVRPRKLLTRHHRARQAGLWEELFRPAQQSDGRGTPKGHRDFPQDLNFVFSSSVHWSWTSFHQLVYYHDPWWSTRKSVFWGLSNVNGTSRTAHQARLKANLTFSCHDTSYSRAHDMMRCNLILLIHLPKLHRPKTGEKFSLVWQRQSIALIFATAWLVGFD